MTTTAGQVAIELRKLADSLDQNPDAAIVAPFVHFGHRFIGKGAKELFLALAPIFPRPYTKKWSEAELELSHNAGVVSITASISRSEVCRLIKPAQPAEFECEPLLSDAEVETLA